MQQKSMLTNFLHSSTFSQQTKRRFTRVRTRTNKITLSRKKWHTERYQRSWCRGERLRGRRRWHLRRGPDRKRCREARPRSRHSWAWAPCSRAPGARDWPAVKPLVLERLAREIEKRRLMWGEWRRSSMVLEAWRVRTQWYWTGFGSRLKRVPSWNLRWATVGWVFPCHFHVRLV